MGPSYLPVITVVTDDDGSSMTPAPELRVKSGLTATFVTGDGPDRIELNSAGVGSVSVAAPITSTGGATPTIGISAATTVAPGSISAADKTKLDSLTAGAAVASVSGTAPIVSSGGATPAISITAASVGAAGSMSSADKTKLDTMTSGAAVASVSGTAPIVSSGGATPAISITAASSGAAGSISAADKTKLDTVTSGAAVASVSGTAPITSSGGGTPAIGITAADGATAGSMSAAHYTLVNGATSGSSISTIMRRDGAGDVAISLLTAAGLIVGGGQLSSFSSVIALTPFTDTFANPLIMRGVDGARHDVTLTGNVTVNAPISYGGGSSLEIFVIQGSGAPWAATWSSGVGGFYFPVGLSGTLISVSAGDADYFEFKHRTVPTSHWVCVTHLKYSPP